jgi:hypothetical protein
MGQVDGNTNRVGLATAKGIAIYLSVFPGGQTTANQRLELEQATAWRRRDYRKGLLRMPADVMGRTITSSHSYEGAEG